MSFHGEKVNFMKVLFITNIIPHYRIDLYNELGRRVDLTIAHTGKFTGSNFFKEEKATPSSFGFLLKYSMAEIEYKNFDVVVIWLNPRLYNVYQLLWGNRKSHKVLLFGIGVSASYNKKYDADRIRAWLIKRLVARSNAAIFYDQYPAIKYAAMGVNPQKLFVAPNTVSGGNGDISIRIHRNSFLFIGSLYQQKGILQLIESYKMALQKESQLPVLEIIGDGPDREIIVNYIQSLGLKDNVILRGQITDDSELSQYFTNALCCISPGQAGLSVQKSFSYGVPFVTCHYPISGGEFTAILNGVTGFFYDGTVGGLASTILNIYQHPNLDHIFQNCREYYTRFRSPEVWVNNFVDALNYANSN